jgi:hypothetical protein
MALTERVVARRISRRNDTMPDKVKQEKRDVHEAKQDLRDDKKHGSNKDVRESKEDLQDEKQDLKKAKRNN